MRIGQQIAQHGEAREKRRGRVRARRSGGPVRTGKVPILRPGIFAGEQAQAGGYGRFGRIQITPLASGLPHGRTWAKPRFQVQGQKQEDTPQKGFKRMQSGAEAVCSRACQPWRAKVQTIPLQDTCAQAIRQAQGMLQISGGRLHQAIITRAGRAGISRPKGVAEILVRGQKLLVQAFEIRCIFAGSQCAMFLRILRMSGLKKKGPARRAPKRARTLNPSHDSLSPNHGRRRKRHTNTDHGVYDYDN